MAAEKILGLKITWYGLGGESHEFAVTGELINNNIEKAIIPLKKENSTELRVCWKIGIMFGSSAGWHIYVDVMTGEVLYVIQEFRT